MSDQYYTTYNTTTKNITGYLISNSTNIANNISAGEDYIEGKHESYEGYVDAGVFVAYTLEEKSEKFYPPAAYYTWSNTNMRWEADSRVPATRNAAISDKTAEIVAALEECDWTQLPDTSPATAAAYLTYRNALRALTTDPAWPFVTLPTSPGIGRLD